MQTVSLNIFLIDRYASASYLSDARIKIGHTEWRFDL